MTISALVSGRSLRTLAALLLTLSFIATPVATFAAAPAFTSGGVSQTVTVGDTVSFTETATDVDGDSITYSLSGEPSGATIDGVTGAFSWLADVVGNYNFSVVATDSSTTPETSSLSVSVTVNPAPQTITVEAGDDLAAKIASANDGDTVVINGTHSVTSTIVVTKRLIIQGGSAGTIESSGSTHALELMAAGTVLRNLTITKTDTVTQPAIVWVAASNTTIEGNTFSGKYGVAPIVDHTSRGLEVSTVSGLNVTGNSFRNLRQPAYINDNTTGSITNNYADGTKGWVIVANSNLSISGNTWGTNVFDIAFIPGSPNNYQDVVAISDANNGANIENQAFPTPVLADVYVNASAAPAGNGTAAAPYQTIAPAMNRVVSGGTIHVAAGTYAESVAVNKPVTILGAQAGVDARTRSASESVVDGTATQSPFMVTADDVTIDGFTVANGSGVYGSGIHSVIGNSGLSILNNIISGNQIGVYAECSAECLIKQNLFDDNNLPGAAGGAAIYTEQSSGLSIVDNEFRNGTTNSAVIFASVSAPSHEDVVFTGNTLYGNSENDSSVYVVGVEGGEFSGNSVTLTGTASTAFSFSGGNEDITVTDNDFMGGARGVRVNDDYGTNADITITNNGITGQSQFGVGILGAGYAGALDAARNWWGSFNGPAVGTASAAFGSVVVGDVSYAPWCVVGDCSQLNTDPVGTGGSSRRSSGGSSSSSNNGSSDTSSTGGNTGGQVLGAATYNFSSDLYYGMTGEAVSALQQVLIDAGYLKIAAPTGWFGPLTQAAVKLYQGAHGIITTGYVGPLTRGQLNLGTAPVAPVVPVATTTAATTTAATTTSAQ